MSGPRATSDEFADRLMDARERGPVVEAERVLAAVSKRLFGTNSEPVKIGRFVIIRRLGAGAMGVVYQGHDPELDRKVAIKLVGMVATDPRARRRSATRTLREAQALARVQHPNAIAVHEVGTHDDQVFIAMEYVEGPTLAQWQRAAPRSWREVAALYLQAGRGLQAAHAAGLVHRDFKPENVLVGQDGAGPGGLRVRVVDFGLARVVSESGATPDGAVAAAADAGGRSGDEESGRAVEGEHDSASSGAADEHPVSATLVSQAQGPENSALAGELAGDERARSLPDGFALHANLTATGALVGTPAYMAPEQFTGSQADVRSDQWSFTAALYEGLFGARPFRDVPLPERARTIARGLPPAPARPKLPRSVRRILERGLQARPEERFPSMRALLDELERALRPPRWGLLALTGASAVAVTIAALQLSASASRCDGAEEALATAWTRDRAAAAERAFLATGRPYAARTWALTSATLDEHAAAWTTMWTEACAATHIRGDQSPVALDLRMRCLDRRRAELAALVDVFIEADADVVDRAAQASAGLTPVDGCADVEALAAPQPVPDDPRIRAAVADARDQLARGKSLRDAGRVTASLDLSQSLYETADQLGYKPLRAEAGLLLGSVLGIAGELAAAEATLDAAFADAQASGHAETAAWVAITAVHVVGFLRRESVAGRRWAWLASPLVEHLGEDALLRGSLRANLGTVAMAEGEYAEAREHFEQALDHFRARGAQELRIANVLANLGAARGRQGDHDAALEHYGQARAIFEATVGPGHPALLSLLGNTCVQHQHLGDTDAAARCYRQVIAEGEASLPAQSPTLGHANNNLGELLLETGEAAASLDPFKRALVIWERTRGPSHPLVAHPLHGLGRAYLAIGEATTALEHLERALTIRAEAGPPTLLSVTRLDLARALTAATPGDVPARAVALATAARDDAPPGEEREAAAAWLSAHAPKDNATSGVDVTPDDGEARGPD